LLGDHAVVVAVDLVEVGGAVLGHGEELLARDLAVTVAVGTGEGGIATLALPALALGLAGLGATAAFAFATLAFALGGLATAPTLAFTAFAFAWGLGCGQLVALGQGLDSER